MYYFVVNPASQSGKGFKIWSKVKAYLDRENIAYEEHLSKYNGDVEVLVRKITAAHSHEGIINIIVLGGDGSLDEALQGIENFSEVNIGYIPTGSSNDFARSLGFCKNPIENLKRILAVREPVLMDLGLLEYVEDSDERSRIFNETFRKTRYFDVSAGIGFDAAICEKALATGGAKKVLNKIGLGKLIYLKFCFNLIFSGNQPDGTLILDGCAPIEVRKLRFLVSMNTCYEGGGFKFAPKAVPDDGYLDVCLVNNIKPLDIIRMFPSAFKGKHVKFNQVTTYHTKSLEYTSQSPLWVHTDGEVYTKATRIRVSCIPKLLRFLK